MEPLKEQDLYDMYDEMLDEVYGEAEIAGMKYSTSYALKDLDPIAYRCGFNDWLDAQVSDGILFEKNDEYYTEDPEEEQE